jgi:hypothetical protein
MTFQEQQMNNIVESDQAQQTTTTAATYDDYCSNINQSLFKRKAATATMWAGPDMFIGRQHQNKSFTCSERNSYNFQ